MISFVKSFGQTHTIKVNDVLFFEHPASITTANAMKNDLVEIKESYYTEVTFVVDLENKNLNYSEFTGFNMNYQIVNVNKTNAILNILFMQENGTEFSLILDRGVDKEDGIVMYVRYNKMVGDVLKTRGWVSANVVVN